MGSVPPVLTSSARPTLREEGASKDGLQDCLHTRECHCHPQAQLTSLEAVRKELFASQRNPQTGQTLPSFFPRLNPRATPASQSL